MKSTIPPVHPSLRPAAAPLRHGERVALNQIVNGIEAMTLSMVRRVERLETIHATLTDEIGERCAQIGERIATALNDLQGEAERLRLLSEATAETNQRLQDMVTAKAGSRS